MRGITLLALCVLMVARVAMAQTGIEVISPPRGAFVNSLPELVTVDIHHAWVNPSLQREDGLYWDYRDRKWDANLWLLRTTYVSGRGWVVPAANLPSGDELVEGRYTVSGYFGSRFGLDVLWYSHTNAGSFTVDKTPPQIAITSFTNGAVVGDLRDLRGTATDALSGINSPLNLGGGVEFSIRRGDNFYWNGNGWSAGALFLPAYWRDGTWTHSIRDSAGNAIRLPGRSDLSAGQSYTITARTADRADNLAQTSLTVTADFANPSIVITAPVAGNSTSSLHHIQGICGDNVGVSRVWMYIERDDHLYWSPSSRSWSPSAELLPATLTTPTTWERNEGLPFRDELRDGTYKIIAVAYDTNGLSATDEVSVYVDTTPPPAPTFLTPSNNSFVRDFSNVTGLASRGSGSRLARLDFLLRHPNGLQWWSGSEWVSRVTYLPATLSAGGFWTVTAPLPRNTSLNSGPLIEGQYTLTAYATDSAGNRSAPADVLVNVDLSNPLVRITQPTSSTHPSLTTASGTVNDNGSTSPGSGVDRVEVFLSRIRDNDPTGTTEYHIWGTSNWTTDSEAIGRSRSVTGASWNTTLPALTAGARYGFTASAYDRVGWSMSSTVYFRIGSPTGPVVNITSPAHTISLETLTNATGTASDPNGVAEVYVQLMRDNVGTTEYWNWIDGWTTTPTQTTATGTSNWSQALPDLPLGTYALRAWALNNLSVTSAPVEHSFTIADRTVPDLTILTPANNTGYDSLSEAAGTAFDTRGIASVRARIMRERQGTFEVYDWLSGEWSPYDSGNTWAEANLQGTTNVQWTLALPQLSGGSYGMEAQARDSSGLTTNAVVLFSINDTIAPQILITQPGARASTIEAISGVVGDNADGSGVESVEVRIRRGSDNFYWNGTGWAATATDLTARIVGEDWTLSSGPGRVNLTDGNYIIQAFARDHAGNENSVSHGLSIDVSQPANMGILAPAHNSTLQSLSQINGTADDGAGGSGIGFVEILLTRANGNSWNGTAWTSSQTFLSTTQTAVNNGINWARTSGLPSGANLPPGTYTVFAVAYDQVGNSVGVSHSFTVPPPTIQFSSATYNVVESGGAATITVTRSSAALAASINYTAGNGTAVKPDDYSETSGTLNFAAGQLSRTFTVPIINDTLDENDETIRLALNTPVGATLGSTIAATLTIIDNDATPALSIDDVTVVEGNSGTTNAIFKVTLSAVSGRNVSVGAIPSNGSAKAPADYTTGGATLVFAPGETMKIFSVPVKGDLLDEPTENFFVLLSSPVNAAMSRGRGVGTITDNDTAPSILIDDLSIGEGNSGQRVAAVRLRLSAASGQVVRVNYATGVGTATAGNDYVAVAPTQISFTTGNLYAYARVLLNGDLLNEPNETFFVNLTAPVNATIADTQAKGTILNDDSAPSLTINDVSITEGNSGSKTLDFTVTLSKASGQTVSANYATANGTATAGSDYVTKNSSLTFVPGGALTQVISIPVNSDVVVEGDETLYVILSGAVNASIGRGRGVGTISNDDASG